MIVQIRAACERAARLRDALTERDAANAEVDRYKFHKIYGCIILM